MIVAGVVVWVDSVKVAQHTDAAMRHVDFGQCNIQPNTAPQALRNAQKTGDTNVCSRITRSMSAEYIEEYSPRLERCWAAEDFEGHGFAVKSEVAVLCVLCVSAVKGFRDSRWS